MKMLKSVAVAMSMALLSTPALADFSGAYSFANWTASPGSGSISTSGTTTLDMWSGNSGFADNTTFLIVAPTASNISFDWYYTTSDWDAGFDPLFYFKTSAGNVCVVCSGFGYGGSGTGSYTATVGSLEQFGFNLNTSDGGFGSSYVQITNFQAVAAVPEPETYAMLVAGLGLLGFAARRRKQKEATLV